MKLSKPCSEHSVDCGPMGFRRTSAGQSCWSVFVVFKRSLVLSACSSKSKPGLLEHRGDTVTSVLKDKLRWSKTCGRKLPTPVGYLNYNHPVSNQGMSSSWQMCCCVGSPGVLYVVPSTLREDAVKLKKTRNDPEMENVFKKIAH